MYTQRAQKRARNIQAARTVQAADGGRHVTRVCFDIGWDSDDNYPAEDVLQAILEGEGYEVFDTRSQDIDYEYEDYLG